MITPLMLILSSIDKDYSCDKPVDISYLSHNDRMTIMSEALKMCSRAKGLLTCENVFGESVVDNSQIVNDAVVGISMVTAVLLQRIKDCSDIFEQSISKVSQNQNEYEDLITDNLLLRLEGRPKDIYSYVYNLMTSKGSDHREKVEKLYELYRSIVGNSVVVSYEQTSSDWYERLVLHSELSFWQGLVVKDSLSRCGVPDVPTAEDFAKARKELNDLGFYGFTNPYKMYMDFSGSRVNRKVGVKISDDVIDFLAKVIKSGGIQIQ